MRSRHPVAKYLIGGLAVAIVVALACTLDLAAVKEGLNALPPWQVELALLLLPLVGFPVSWLHLLAGLKFGVGLGLIAIYSATVFHHVVASVLARQLPTRWQSTLLNRSRHYAARSPTHMVVLCVMIPGLPYTLQIFTLSLLGIPLRLLISIACVLHTLRAAATLYLGTVLATPSTEGGLIAAGYYLVLGGVSVWAVRRLRRAPPVPCAQAESPPLSLLSHTR